jgi:hypothetical protein
MTDRCTIEIHIVMDESGAFVADGDPDVAAERAEQELGEDADVRQIALTLGILPPSQSSMPVKATCKID